MRAVRIRARCASAIQSVPIGRRVVQLGGSQLQYFCEWIARLAGLGRAAAYRPRCTGTTADLGHLERRYANRRATTPVKRSAATVTVLKLGSMIIAVHLLYVLFINVLRPELSRDNADALWWALDCAAGVILAFAPRLWRVPPTLISAVAVFAIAWVVAPTDPAKPQLRLLSALLAGMLASVCTASVQALLRRTLSPRRSSGGNH
jgi:hypothetical protein